MSKARQLADLGNAYDDGALSNRRINHNGAMQVAQRGTSVTAQTGSAFHCCDRFKTEANGPTYDVEQSTDAPNGFSYSMKVTMDGAFSAGAGELMIPFEYLMEGDDMQRLAYGTSDAKTVTLSFWIKSNKTGTYVVDFANNNSSQLRGQSQSYTVNSPDTWEYKTLIFTGDTSTAFETGNTREFQIFWWMVAGTTYTSGTLATSWENRTNANRAVGISSSSADNDYWQITGVQLEVGDTATPFEHRSYGQELALCQRYFIKYGGEGTYSLVAGGTWTLSNTFTATVAFPTEMRAKSSISYGGTWGIMNMSGTVSSISYDSNASTKKTVYLNCSGSGTVGNAGGLIASNDSSAYLFFDAEL